MAFREAFTKSKEQLLDYDDNASLYFGGTGILCVLIPFSLYFVSTLVSSLRKDEIVPCKTKTGSLYHYCKCSSCSIAFKQKRKEARNYLKSYTFITQVIIFLVLTLLLYRIIVALSSASEIQTFNPFDVLEIDERSSEKMIRKAYRTLSLRYHPDRNQNDPSSAAKFIMIAKAYQTLTDEVGGNSRSLKSLGGLSFRKSIELVATITLPFNYLYAVCRHSEFLRLPDTITKSTEIQMDQVQ